MSKQDRVVICSAARTPIGAFQGAFSNFSGNELGSFAIKEAVKRAGVSANDIDECFMGCVLPAGQGQAPARQAALKADLPQSLPCTTVNKMCGSGLEAIMIGHDTILAGTNDIVLAGGMESMTNAPYLLPKARGGFRMGHGEVKDHMFLDGLEDAYDKGKLMGYFADGTAASCSLTREAQDAFALESLKRAQTATTNGTFKNEIVAVSVEDKKGTILVDEDESPKQAKPEKIPLLKPAFNKDGTVTAANASSISDGAAALIIARESVAKAKGLKIEAVISGHASFAHAPADFCTAPLGAMKKLYKKLNWTPESVDVYEINEAFAVVTMAAIKEFNLPHEKVNTNGGACALGHPIGATGARLITTLLYALKNQKKKRGMASLCIGGGEAVAMGIEVYSD